MRETPCCLCQTILKLILLKRLTPHSDIWMTYLILIIVTFEQMIDQIYSSEFQSNNAFILLIPKLRFLDLNLPITNGIVSSKMFDKQDAFNFEIIVNIIFLDGDVPLSLSYGVYICQLIRFAIVCSKVDGFNRNLFLTAKLLKQGYRYHKIREAFSKSYHRHSKLIV